MRLVLTSLLVAFLAGGALTAPPTAYAAAATCQGRPATIEGNTGTVLGTAGNDVIVVTDDVHRVDAGEGDDVICVVDNNTARLIVLAGAGADLVDTTAAASYSSSLMGTGTDTFVGGKQPDQVVLEYDPAAPTAIDVVRTGGGADSLGSHSAPVDADLGPGDDNYTAGFTEGQPGSRVLLGEGYDRISLDDEGADLHFDLRTGTLLRRGVQSMVTGGDEVYAVGPEVWIRGTRTANDLTVLGCKVTLYGGGGHDELLHVGGSEPKCDKRRARLYGQGGPDALGAANGDDVLIGGAGKDRANGGGGRDRCVAEKTSTCER